MSRTRKYRPGRKIRTVATLLREIDAGRYVYWGKRPCHPSWLGSMQYFVLRTLARYGQFRFAKENRV